MNFDKTRQKIVNEKEVNKKKDCLKGKERKDKNLEIKKLEPVEKSKRLNAKAKNDEYVISSDVSSCDFSIGDKEQGKNGVDWNDVMN